MSDLSEIEDFMRQHGKPMGTPVAPYQTRKPSPWEQRVVIPPEARAAVAELARMLQSGEATQRPDGTIVFTDKQGRLHEIVDRIDGYTETVTEPTASRKPPAQQNSAP